MEGKGRGRERREGERQVERRGGREDMRGKRRGGKERVRKVEEGRRKKERRGTRKETGEKRREKGRVGLAEPKPQKKGNLCTF